MTDQRELWPLELLENARRRRALPICPALFPDESLSSWVVRLADAHGMSVQALGSWLMGCGRQIFGEDVDRGAWDELARALCDATGLARSELIAATLLGFEGALWGEMSRRGPVRWVLPIVKSGTFRSGYGVQYCPVCLATDPVPYFRLQWRLGFVVSCPLHGCLLSDRCERCGAPVAAHRWRTGRLRELGTTGIVRCHLCGADRRHLPAESASEPLAAAQALMQTALTAGEAFVDGIPVHSVMFFAGAAMVWSMLDEVRLADVVWSSLELPVPSTERTASRYGGFEVRDLRRRVELLVGFERFMALGPAEVFRRMRNRGSSSAVVMRYATASSPAPYWYWRAARLELDRTFYVPNDAEIQAAVRFCSRTSADGRARVREVCRLLGMSGSSSARVARAINGHARSRGVTGRLRDAKMSFASI